MINAVMNAVLAIAYIKPEKVRTSTGFEPVSSRYRCDWAMKPLTLGAPSYQYREVTGSNPIEVLTFLSFYTQ